MKWSQPSIVIGIYDKKGAQRYLSAIEKALAKIQEIFKKYSG